MSPKNSTAATLEPPPPPILDSEPAGDAAAAKAALDIGAAGGDPASTVGTDREETRAGGGSAGEPPATAPRPVTEAQRRAGLENLKRANEVRLAGKPKSGRLEGDSKLTGKSLDKMMKSDIATTLQIAERELVRIREDLETAHIENAQLRTANEAGRGELLDDGINDACAASIEFVANAAAIKFGPEAQVTPAERDRLALLWAKVAKLYLGQHAQYSPLAAALLATGGVALEKYVAIEAAKKAATS